MPPDRIEPVEGLVENQQAGIVGEGLGQFRALAHAQRVGAHGAVHGGRHADPLQRLLRPLACLAAAEPVEFHQVTHPFQRRDVGVQDVDGRAETDRAQQAILPPRRLTHHADSAHRRPQLAGDQVQQRGLARPVGADQPVRTWTK